MHIKNDCLNSIISKLIDLVKIKFYWRFEGEFKTIFRKLIDLLRRREQSRGGERRRAEEERGGEQRRRRAEQRRRRD